MQCLRCFYLTMTHTPGIGNFRALTPKIGNFLVFLVILSNHKIHHIYLTLAVLLTYNQNCMMYFMRLCNAEYSQNPHLRVPSRVKFWWFNFLEGT